MNQPNEHPYFSEIAPQGLKRHSALRVMGWPCEQMSAEDWWALANALPMIVAWLTAEFFFSNTALAGSGCEFVALWAVAHAVLQSLRWAIKRWRHQPQASTASFQSLSAARIASPAAIMPMHAVTLTSEP
jgi:hypothetical protein